MKATGLTLKLLVIVLLGTIAFSCREEYFPDIDSRAGVMVVDGLVTDQPGPAYVKLSLAQAYNSAYSFRPVTGAKVWIYESTGDKHRLSEKSRGYYVTDTSTFKPVPGRTYTLHIETQGKQIYESREQALLPPAETEGISGIITEKEYIIDDLNGNPAGKIENSVETFVDFASAAGSHSHYRFQSKLMLGYTWIDYSTMPFPSIVYCWKKIRKDMGLNLSGSDYAAIASDSVSRYSVNYFPLSKYFYELADREWPDRYFLQIRQYTLNEDAFIYYREVEKQLTATGKIFDPIATQVSSNITCLTDPERLVLGFFEVSSCNKKTYTVKPMTGDDKVTYRSTFDMDTIPDNGWKYQITPDFWN